MNESENITQLKNLIDKLDKEEYLSDEYHNILREIKSIINQEEDIISKLKEDDVKLKRYEGICKNILSIISSANM